MGRCTKSPCTAHPPAIPSWTSQFSATFSLDHRNVDVTGFYDGDGIYRIRFMPDTPGHWHWQTELQSR